MNRAAFEPVQAALIWALGRVGGRVPVYGPLNLVLPVSRVSDWIEQLLRTSELNQPAVQLAIMQLSRRTDDRFRDISTSLRDRIISKLSPTSISKHLLQLIADGGVLEGEEASLILGESLPAGLRLA